MFRKSLMALALAGTVVLVGCGGSGGDDSSSTTPASTARNDVAGPLDTLQEPVSSQVLAPLASAAAGTPLAGVVTCVDQIVVGDMLDIVDVLASQADAGALNPTTSAPVVQAELTNLVSDLTGLLTSLAGGSGACGSSIPAPGGFGTNPLAGGPLEDFGATLLSTLASVQSQLTGAGGSPSLSTLNGLIAQLAAGYATAFSMLPAEATTAPVVGPSLGLIGTALNDLGTTVTAAAAGNPATTGAAITATVENLLGGLLVDVLPIAMLEDAGGQSGALSGPIADALDQLSTALAGGFTMPGSNLGGTALLDELTALLAPLTDPTSVSDPTVVLTTLLTQISTALGGGDTGSLPVPDIGPASLDTALAELTTLLSGAGANDSPLAPLVDTLTGLLGLLIP